jgi:hypothetical protein
MALSRETWALIEQEFARAVFWSHAWGRLQDDRGPHPLIMMPPERRAMLERRYDRVQKHIKRARWRYQTAPRQTFPGYL